MFFHVRPNKRSLEESQLRNLEDGFIDPSINSNEFRMINNSNNDFSLRKSNFSEIAEKSENNERNSIIDSPPSTMTDNIEICEWYHIKGYEARKRNEMRLAVELYTKALEYNSKNFKVYNIFMYEYYI